MMKTSYFPHDSNAKDDPKVTLMIDEMGLEAYGAFWVVIETLREQPNYRYPLKLLPSLARKYNITAQKMQVVVEAYELFSIEDGEFFFSPSLRHRMGPLDEKREQSKIAGQISGHKRKKRLEAQLEMLSYVHSTERSFNDSSTPAEQSREEKNRVEKKKEEESKGNRVFDQIEKTVSLMPDIQGWGWSGGKNIELIKNDGSSQPMDLLDLLKDTP